MTTYARSETGSPWTSQAHDPKNPDRTPGRAPAGPSNRRSGRPSRPRAKTPVRRMARRGQRWPSRPRGWLPQEDWRGRRRRGAAVPVGFRLPERSVDHARSGTGSAPMRRSTRGPRCILEGAGRERRENGLCRSRTCGRHGHSVTRSGKRNAMTRPSHKSQESPRLWPALSVACYPSSRTILSYTGGVTCPARARHSFPTSLSEGSWRTMINPAKLRGVSPLRRL
jgi:hypothetical protein